ncbi:MAG TPA: hypothetical protein VGG28_29460 [Kofleriaceae bacterium]
MLVACGPSRHGPGGDDDDGGVTGPHTETSIVITPTNPIVQLDLNMPGTQDFVVTANYADGTTEDVTSQAMWSVANPAVGAMAGATLDIPGFATDSAEVSKLTATVGAFTGEAQITVAAYRQSGTETDFFFILPYQDPTGDQMKPLDFSTLIPSLDVFFLEDTTGSMGGETKNLQAALTGTIVPGIQANLPNTQFGVGAFDDFPVNGDSGSAPCVSGDDTDDQPFKLRQAITANSTLVQTAVNGLTTASGATIGCGGDTPESGIEAIYQAATGEGLTGPSPTSVPVNHSGVGGVGFRAGTMPVIVPITDAISHDTDDTSAAGTDCGVNYTTPIFTGAGPAHSHEQTEAALSSICARVVGIAAQDGECDGTAYLTALATSSGARVPPTAWDVGTRPAGCAAGQCCTGESGVGVATDADGLCPEVFQVTTSGTGVSQSIVTGIAMLTRFATFTVPTETAGVMTDIDGNALPSGHTTADFVKAVVPTSFTLPPPPPVVPNPTFDMTQFYGVTPGTTLTFQVNAFNDFIPSTDQAQIFEATITVTASGCTPLDQRNVLILVPPIAIVVQ